MLLVLFIIVEDLLIVLNRDSEKESGRSGDKCTCPCSEFQYSLISKYLVAH
jgi:hypothetical protein